MPYAGAVAEQPGTLFALSYGANGVIFGLLAAEIICAAIMRRVHPEARLFKFDR